MGLSQIRDAAIASQFASRAELDAWLTRAVGDHRRYLDQALGHARRAIALCPMLGQAYISLGELCFLEGNGAVFKAACAQQALAVRPYDGMVLLAAGTEAALAGDYEQALRLWRPAFHSGLKAQYMLVDSFIASGVPPAVILEHFQPDFIGLRIAYGKYRQAFPGADLKPLLAAYIQAAEAKAAALHGEEAAQAWLETSDLLIQYGDSAAALERAQRALACDDSRFDVHYRLARQLLAAGQYRQAEEHLQWCCLRKPEDPELREKLEIAVKNRLQQGRARSAEAATSILRR
jgi:tetratricopeptide (TPR) repeat protein